VKNKHAIAVLKVTGSAVEGTTDEVATELPIDLVLNNKPLVTLLCTPTELEELAVGFLLSEGLLNNRSSLQKLEVSEEQSAVRIELDPVPAAMDRIFEKRTISSGCGKGITFTNFPLQSQHRIEAQKPLLTLATIRQLLNGFRNISTLYLETGGVHSAALADAGTILFFSEDIGRHNAVDKLIGKAFLRSVPLENKILITSGRVTSEIIMKAGRNRFPILISRAAPSCMAVSAAEDLGITLIGFARGERLNIYSWPNRIFLGPDHT